MNYAQYPLWRLQKVLKDEQVKFDDSRYAGQVDRIAEKCARLRLEIRRKKLVKQKLRTE